MLGGWHVSGGTISLEFGAYTMVSPADLPRSETNVCWKRARLSLMRYARERSCCLRNWMDLVLPVRNAFLRLSRTCNAWLKQRQRFTLVATYDRDLIDGRRRVRGDPQVRLGFGLPSSGHRVAVLYAAGQSSSSSAQCCQ
jgi:hypothetical protein